MVKKPKRGACQPIRAPKIHVKTLAVAWHHNEDMEWVCPYLLPMNPTGPLPKGCDMDDTPITWVVYRRVLAGA